MSKKTKARAKRRAQKRLGRPPCCCGEPECDGTGPWPVFHHVGQEPNKRHQEDEDA